MRKRASELASLNYNRKKSLQFQLSLSLFYLSYRVANISLTCINRAEIVIEEIVVNQNGVSENNEIGDLNEIEQSKARTLALN